MHEIFLKETADAFWALLAVMNPALRYEPCHIQGVADYLRKVLAGDEHPSVVIAFWGNGVQLASQVDDPDVLMVMLDPTWIRPKE